MLIKVTPHIVKIIKEESEPINEKEINVSKCTFEFSEEITNDYVKEAYFTLNGNTYKQIIVNNECDYPGEILTQKGELEIGVVAFLVENDEEIKRYNPMPDYYSTWKGSLKEAENTEPITPSDKEQIEQQLTNISNQMDNIDIEANKVEHTTTITITRKDGTSYDVQVLDGEKGEKGDKGNTGATGPQGPKPVKGVDYYTQEDKAEISNEIATNVANEVSSQVGDLTSATPLAASSTAGMIDTTRIYVNTTDGNWYYYNGSAWTIGGTYQSTVIGENEISYYNFDDNMNTDLGITKLIPTFTTGYIGVDGSIITDAAAASYEYSNPIQLKENQTICFYGRGYLTSVSMVTTCDSTGSNRKCVLRSVDNTTRLYKYTATYDCYVIICSAATQLSKPYILDDIITNVELPLYYNAKISSNDLCILIDENTTYINNKYIYYPSGFASNFDSAKASDFVDIVGGSTIKLVCDGTLNYQLDYRGLAFYDKNKTYISGYQYEVVKTKELSVPANACYIRITRNDITKYLYVYYTKLSDYMTQYVKKDDDENNKYYELYKAFNIVGVIGDSLASGECVYKQDGVNKYANLYEFSWGQYMARDSGNTYYNFSDGGLTTRSWFTNNTYGYPKASDGNHTCKAYIIALGVNDMIYYGIDYLGSSSDINLSDPSQNANTFYGNYAKIIQSMKALQPKAKFFLFTLPITDATAGSFNAAIKYMATVFDNVYIIDLESHVDDFTTGSYIDNNKRGGHYNAVSYEYMAKLFEKWISEYMYSNYSEFLQVEFIGTNYEWTS